MQFLWQLLPGAREARNQVFIGYAWLFALALWFGIPEPEAGTNFGKLIDAVGPIGTGVGISALAFLIGSLSDDLAKALLRSRGARAFSYASDAPASLFISRMTEALRAELERLEASIDRDNAELLLRVGLLPPIAAAAAAGARDRWTWAVAGGIAVVALLMQIARRLREQQMNLAASYDLRRGHEEDLSTEIEVRKRQAEQRAKEAQEREEEQRRERKAEEERESARIRERLEQEQVEREQLEAVEQRGELSAAGVERLSQLRAAHKRQEQQTRDLQRRVQEVTQETQRRIAKAKAGSGEATTRRGDGKIRRLVSRKR